ncbi:TetR/AcrR family transcriptional regulator [Miniphocaeibacter halophilus]|uniref:Helix-turn-helix transcriptional regulator n=1 Tax=Miniphocaeibacter halophilus TaxID=2931922 RepID=A0AC61MPH0_9FIRM|nr:helix-turn-helix domain-containing protein [Miniphocaeibacter halophilus]QQK07292.1 helix-turn-helix transcriptional regulator [Miniphocaeibacter halophilus]
MVGKKRRENEKEKMRKLILNASVKIILEEGYDKLSMRKIADRIEYSATTIYLK